MAAPGAGRTVGRGERGCAARYALHVLVCLNGDIIPAEQARVSVFDRGFLMGDGIYEGLRAFDGSIVRADLHIRRMDAGLREARIAWDAARLGPMSRELLEANGLRDAFLYWQVSRGAPAPGQPVRTRVPAGEMRPTVFGYAVPAAPLGEYEHGRVPCKSAVTAEDTRWLRGRVKAVSLLGSVLGAVEASEAGAEDAIFVRGGVVAESTAANVIVALDGPAGPEVVTPSLESAPILAGVTRDVLLACGAGIVERPVARAGLERATEVMLTGTLTMVTSIVRLDGKPVGDGRAGPVARRLLAELVEAIRHGGGCA